MNYMESFTINVVSGLLVSFIFLLFLLKFFRPKFEISTYICQSEEPIEINGKQTMVPKYSFKLINKSIYHAFDAKIELFLMQPVTHTGGSTNLRFKSIPIRTSNINHIKRYRRKYHKKDPSALFAILCHTNEPIYDMLKEDDTYVELKITVRHGLTGLADTFTQQFGNCDIIRHKHKFQFANKLDTMPINKTI